MSAEGRITHNTAGRVNVEPGRDSVTLRLWGWSQKSDATLSLDEADKLVRKLRAAITQVRGADDFSDLA